MHCVKKKAGTGYSGYGNVMETKEDITGQKYDEFTRTSGNIIIRIRVYKKDNPHKSHAGTTVMIKRESEYSNPNR